MSRGHGGGAGERWVGAWGLGTDAPSPSFWRTQLHTELFTGPRAGGTRMWGAPRCSCWGGRGPVPSCRGEAAQADASMWTGDPLTGRSVFGLSLLLPCVLGEGEAGREGVASLLSSRRCVALVLSAGCPVMSLTLTLITWSQHRPTGRGSAQETAPRSSQGPPAGLGPLHFRPMDSHVHLLGFHNLGQRLRERRETVTYLCGLLQRIPLRSPQVEGMRRVGGRRELLCPLWVHPPPGTVCAPAPKLPRSHFGVLGLIPWPPASTLKLSGVQQVTPLAQTQV